MARARIELTDEQRARYQEILGTLRGVDRTEIVLSEGAAIEDLFTPLEKPFLGTRAEQLLAPLDSVFNQLLEKYGDRRTPAMDEVILENLPCFLELAGQNSDLLFSRVGGGFNLVERILNLDEGEKEKLCGALDEKLGEMKILRERMDEIDVDRLKPLDEGNTRNRWEEIQAALAIEFEEVEKEGAEVEGAEVGGWGR